jgi:hypothetical protein
MIDHRKARSQQVAPESEIPGFFRFPHPFRPLRPFSPLASFSGFPNGHGLSPTMSPVCHGSDLMITLSLLACHRVTAQKSSDTSRLALHAPSDLVPSSCFKYEISNFQFRFRFPAPISVFSMSAFQLFPLHVHPRLSTAIHGYPRQIFFRHASTLFTLPVFPAAAPISAFCFPLSAFPLCSAQHFKAFQTCSKQNSQCSLGRQAPLFSSHLSGFQAACRFHAPRAITHANTYKTHINTHSKTA